MRTGAEAADAVLSRKVGSENAIVVQLAADRFTGEIPPGHEPRTDEHGRYRIMLLAQACSRCSFGHAEAGAGHELHLWLQLGSAAEDASPIAGVDVTLPPQRWLALFVATDNPVVEMNLRTFGFEPTGLTGVQLRAAGGSVALQDGAHLEWFVGGEGRGPATVGIHHALLTPGDGPGAAPHRVAARMTDAVMGQPGELHVHGRSLEPFLLSGERLTALVHRMPSLEADIIWRLRAEVQ